MLPSTRDPFETKLSAFVQLHPEELDCLAKLQGPAVKLESGQRLTEEGQVAQKLFILREGWAYSYKDLANGKRQIISFPIAGDCVGVRSSLLQTADHSSTALTEVVVKPVDTSHLVNCFTRYPRLCHSASLVGLSRRGHGGGSISSISNEGVRSRGPHISSFELGERLSLIGLGSATGYDCPLNQYVLADALGITAIHVNRVLRQLRDQELLTVRKEELRSMIVLASTSSLVTCRRANEGDVRSRRHRHTKVGRSDTVVETVVLLLSLSERFRSSRM